VNDATKITIRACFLKYSSGSNSPRPWTATSTYILLALIFVFAAPSDYAAPVSSDIPLRDYVHTVWTQHDGLPLGPIHTILQTADGYLWVFTDEGLLRFDGMRFVRVSTLCNERMRFAAGAPDGGLWTSCGSHLIRRTSQGQFVEVSQTFLTTQFLDYAHMLVDRVGRPWFFGASIKYIEPDGTGGRELTLPGVSQTIAETQDSEGAFWVSDRRRVVRIYEDHHEDFPVRVAFGLTPARAGGVFAVSPDQIWRLRAGTTPSLIATAPQGVTFSNVEGCVAEDGDGTLWIGTRQHGVARLCHGIVETFPDCDVRAHAVAKVFVDREGTIWTGSPSGLHRYRKPMVRSMPDVSRHLTGVPRFVYVDSRDDVWIAPGENLGASRMNASAGTWQTIERRGTDWPYGAVGEDGAGRIWLSNFRDIGYIVNGTFAPVQDESHTSIANVWAFQRDGRGQLWALAEGVGLYHVAPGAPRLVIRSPHASTRFLVSERFGIWISVDSPAGVEQHLDGSTQFFPTDDADPHGIHHTIIEDGDSIWVGTVQGLKRWRHGIWTTWTRDHGLPDQGQVQEIIADRVGSFWMMTSSGLLMLPRAQLDATPDGVPGQLTFARVGVLDGVIALPDGLAQSPRVSRDGNGRMYFATSDSVVIVDPSTTTEPSLIPPIVLESVTVDNQVIDLTTKGRFVEPFRLQFDYTSLSLRSPENARFRYQLLGYDPNWVEAGGDRDVTYGTLHPGSYCFRVIGAGSEGVWNEEGASFYFEVRPVFWRTWWFRGILIGFVLLVVAGMYRQRVRQLTRQFNLGLEARLEERTRVAREIHDTFLQTIQGSKMVADHALKDPADHARMVRAMKQLSTWLAQATDEGRAALNSLRASTTEKNNLAEALRRAIDECRIDSPQEMLFSVKGDSREMHPLIRDEIYRIGYEAIRNACAHSGGELVEVTLEYAHDLTLRVTDNGVGIDSNVVERGKENHFGLRGMRERAERIGSKFSLVSSQNSGTVITLTVPGRIAFLSERPNWSYRLKSPFSRN
jgi:signal transduction histidine kinase/ligand-binding sensor domain-containing protein